MIFIKFIKKIILIDLKKLNEDGKVIFVEFENEHVLFIMEEYDIYIKNFFLDDGDINY